MAIFAVKYQLNEAKNYQPLWDEMKRLSAHKAMRSLYLLEGSWTAKQLRAHFASFIDNDDMLFVTTITEKPEPHRCYEGTQAWVDARF